MDASAGLSTLLDALIYPPTIDLRPVFLPSVICDMHTIVVCFCVSLLYFVSTVGSQSPRARSASAFGI